MNRRDLFGVGVGLGAIVLANPGRALADGAKDPRGTLLDALAACLTTGQACAAHCQTELAQGAKEFAHCNAAVTDLLAVVTATMTLVSRQSGNAKRLADTCAAVAKECSNACAEHKAHWAHKMHLECKACMEACDACTKACAAFV